MDKRYLLIGSNKNSKTNYAIEIDSSELIYIIGRNVMNPFSTIKTKLFKHGLKYVG